MIQYVFRRPVPIAELDAELRLFARLAAEEGFDTVSSMVVILQPTLNGNPFELRRHGSDIPIRQVTYESRLTTPKQKRSPPTPARDPALATSDE